MKYLFFALALSSMAMAHKSTKVQSLDQATKKFIQTAVVFSETNLPEDLHFLKTLKQYEAEGLGLYQFMVKGDWGPIHGLVAIKAGEVVGMEILSYTEHEGDGVTRSVFLKQYKGVTKATLGSASIKPLPKEPKASRALIEVLNVIFARG